jgi:hypothetical protein
MAKRRMLSSDVISTDAFLGMSLRARELYVHLTLAGDDDGFVSNVVMTTRSVGATKKHVNELVDNGYLLQFDGGLCLIAHWLVANTVKRTDTYHPTIYQREMSLVTAEGGVYRLLTEEELSQKAEKAPPDDDDSVTKSLRERNEPVTQLKENKKNLNKNNQTKERRNTPRKSSPWQLQDQQDYDMEDLERRLLAN